ncbi:MAG: YraN family protein [Elusimicrobiota bacterium]|jgi:putative endonuclease|nr:YraN family protein [Elusimicrobiota bacterium]
MITLKRKTGDEGEDKAAEFLKAKGYKILARNYASKYGEIDIIARLKNAIVFVEVKTRASMSYGGGVAAVNVSKQNKITKTAITYIKENKPKFDSITFDIITITDGKIEHIQNAFAIEGYTI